MQQPLAPQTGTPGASVGAGAAPSDAPSPAPRLPRRALTLATLVAGLFIALAEVDRLIGRISAAGHAASMQAANMPKLPVPWPTPQSNPWFTLHSLDESARLFVGTFTFLDCLLALTYGALLALLLRRVRRSGATDQRDPLRLLTRARPLLGWAAAVVDIVENLVLAALALSGGPGATLPVHVAGLAGLLTVTKWVLLVIAVAPILYAVVATSEGQRWRRRWARALLMQRFSLLAVLPVAALALVPGPGIFDQLPDVQRAWFEGPSELGGRSLGPLHAAVAIFFLGLIAAGLFVLGRLFTDDALRRTGAADLRPRAPLWQWLYGPAVLLLGVLAVLAVGGGRQIRWVSLTLFCLLPILILVISWALRRWRPEMEQPDAMAYDVPTARQIWKVGDLLALAGIAAASLALIRSHLVLLMLGEGEPLQWAMPFLGLASAMGIWWIGIPALTAVTSRIPLVRELAQPRREVGTLVLSATESPDGRPPTPQLKKRLYWLAWAFILLSTAVLALLALQPVVAARWLGVLGTVMLALGGMMLLVGSSAIVHAFYAPPEIFWTRWFRLREAPVASLLTLALLVAVLGSSTVRVHGVRPGPPTSVSTQMDYADVVQAWAQRTDNPECTVRTGDGDLARPLILVAAEGGGIRAAYWTAAVLALLEEETGCGIDAIALASGVSGGAVGLAVARATPAADWERTVWQMGDPNALSQAALGLLLRDTTYTVGGVPMLADGQWLDRAALMERSWEASWREVQAEVTESLDESPAGENPAGEDSTDEESTGEESTGEDLSGLAGDFYGEAHGDLHAPLVLNSTDATTGCRILVSHVAPRWTPPAVGDQGDPREGSAEGSAEGFAEAGSAADASATPPETVGSAIRCTDAQAPLAYSRDLIDYLETGTDTDTDTDTEGCLPGLRLSTAAMLAARFPYVTPSGVLGPCGHSPRVQLIDGGYAEGSGLGSLVDMTPGLLAATTDAPGLPIQPIVVFLDNGRGGDLLPTPPQARSELLVPPMGALTAGSTQRSAAAWLHRAASLPTVGTVLTPEVFVIAQGSKPTVEAPLGWVLSDASREDMDASLVAAANTACDRTQDEADASLNQGYHGTRELLRLLGSCS